jgi:hypothetical protein
MHNDLSIFVHREVLILKRVAKIINSHMSDLLNCDFVLYEVWGFGGCFAKKTSS